MGFALFLLGKTDQSIEYFQEATEASADVPFYRYWAKTLLAMSYALSGQMENAGRIMAEVLEFTTAGGARNLGDFTLPNYGIALCAQGRMKEGLTMLKEAAEIGIKGQRKRLLVVVEFFFWKCFLSIGSPYPAGRFFHTNEEFWHSDKKRPRRFQKSGKVFP